MCNPRSIGKGTVASFYQEHHNTTIIAGELQSVNLPLGVHCGHRPVIRGEIRPETKFVAATWHSFVQRLNSESREAEAGIGTGVCVMEGETPVKGGNGTVNYISYVDETQLDCIMALIDKELSEPYSIFTYRYFITLWPDLCFMAFDGDECVGTIVCKMGQHRSTFRGYIAMLVVIKPYRGKGIATELVTKCLQVMRDSGCDEVTLEAEVTNKGALALYGNLGFVRAKRLHRYYLNGVDAYRLKLLFPRPQDAQLLQELQALEQRQDCGHDHSHDHHNHHHDHHNHSHGESCGHDHHHDHHHHSHGDGCGHDHHHPSGSQGGSSARPVHLQDLSRKSASSRTIR